MCGIAGVLSHGRSDMVPVLTAMADAMLYRGPDAGAVWTDPTAGVGLAHRRLAILDLSPQGGQPMISASGRYVISYNGEVYNHQALRTELEREGISAWRGHSDTEVLLAAIERWGVQKALPQINGMFAFAVWDREERTLTLARDRMGEKPLYVGWIGEGIAFASELKALRRLPEWCERIDQRAVGYFLRFGYVPTPLSIHERVFKLPPASFIVLNLLQLGSPPSVEEFVARTCNYWSLSRVAGEAADHALEEVETEVMAKFDHLLGESIRLRMEADVPVGAMLSGGIDSSLVAAIMQRFSSRPVRTFTVGFQEGRFDEAKYSRPVAAHIGSEHTEIHLLPRDALAIIPRLPEIYDEPFADASQIPTALVSAVARQHVTVALSGDGGDELFGGYGRYFAARRIWSVLGWWPAVLRRACDAVLALPDRMFGGAGQMTASNGARAGSARLAFRMRRFARRIKASSFEDFYANILSLSLHPLAMAGWPSGFPSEPLLSSVPQQLTDVERRMMFIDQAFYLPDDILVKCDRASMAASLELRIPLLDHRVVEFAWRLPTCYRRQGQSGKLLMRRLLHRYVPRELVERPKQGFEIPLDEWLRGPLRGWMLDLLDSAKIRVDGYLDGETVKALVREHLSGRGDFGYALWTALMFQAWRERWR